MKRYVVLENQEIVDIQNESLSRKPYGVQVVDSFDNEADARTCAMNLPLTNLLKDVVGSVRVRSGSAR